MTPETPEAVSDEPQSEQAREMHKGIARAMQAIGDIAKLYRKHGSPKNYQYAELVELDEQGVPVTDADGNLPRRITSSFNHAWKRAVQLNAWRTRRGAHVSRARCGNCGGWFVGPTIVRCQCPTPKPQKLFEGE